MARRYEEVEERAGADLAGAKVALKALGAPQRAHVIASLLKYFEDDGSMRSPQLNRPRRTVVLDGVEYWLARRPARKERT